MKLRAIRTAALVSILVSALLFGRWGGPDTLGAGNPLDASSLSRIVEPAVSTSEGTSIVINELLPAPLPGSQEWVELYHGGGHLVYLPAVARNSSGSATVSGAQEGVSPAAGSALEISGWQVSDQDGHNYTIPDALPPVPLNGYVLIYFDGQGAGADDYNFADGIAVLHTPAGLTGIFEDDADQVALYSSGDHNPSTIRDFVAYGGLPGEDGNDAVAAGIWNESWWVDMYVSSGAQVEERPATSGLSTGLYPGHSNTDPEDWAIYQGDDRTPGAANVVPGVYWATAFDGIMMGSDGFALGWALVPGATYHLQIDDNQDFSSPLVDEILPEPRYAPVEPPPPGSYYWRVRPIDAEGHPGAWSAPLRVGVRAVLEADSVGTGVTPAAVVVQQTLVPSIQWLRQRKDTKLLCIDGCAQGNPSNDPDTLENAWDAVHPDAIFTHGRNNCVRASVAMVATRYGGDLSQDRIGYQMFEVWGDPAQPHVGQPDRDLGHDSTTSVGGNDGSTAMDLLEWALNVAAANIHYEIHSCGWVNQGATAHPTWNDVTTWINAGRPILEAHANCHNTPNNPATPQNESCDCSWHATVIAGYRTLAGGVHQVRNLDPWSGPTWVDYEDDPATAANETFFMDFNYVPPAAAPGVRSDEPSIWTDSDGDRIMDFDELMRFPTSTNNPDSDADWVPDKPDLAEVYFNATGGYAPKAAGPDMDHDGLRKEVDPDNDAGGTVDGCEDANYNGRRDAGETNNFSAGDDSTCVPAFDIRSPLQTSPAEVGDKTTPDKLMIRVLAGIPEPAGTLTLGTSDFDVQIQGDAASILVPPYRVGDEYWLIVQPPAKGSAGYYDLTVTLQGTQTDTETDAVRYLDAPRGAIDEVLVVDNSGSMADYNKMPSAKNAARAFIDRWKEQDMVGLVAFSTTVSIPFPLVTVTSTTTLGNARTAVNSMLDAPPGNWLTAIGGGLLEGKKQLASAGAGHPQSIVLLSDGMENVSPKWNDPASGVRAAFTGCSIKVHTVAIGPSQASWRALLQDISDNACNGDGEAWHTSGGGTSPTSVGAQAIGFPSALGNRLADIYLSIAELDARDQRLWEATGSVDRERTDTYNVYVPGGLPEAIWTVNWDQGTLQVELTDPDGKPVVAGYPGLRRIQDATHDQFRIGAPKRGTWTIAIRMDKSSQATPVEYLAVLSGHSDVQMWLLFGLSPLDRTVGMEMPIHVVLADEKPVARATVSVTIQSPNKELDRTLILYDDGKHGDGDPDDGLYGNKYMLEMAGSYTVKAVATGKDNEGEPFARYATRSFYVRPRVLYLYNGQDPVGVATAYSYQRLLEANGFVVDLLPVDALTPATDLGPYEYAIVGPKTGDGSIWGTADAIEALRYMPVLGLGDGGYAYFGKLGLAIGYGNGWHGMDTSVYAVDLTSPVWSDPYPIPVPPRSRVVQVYNETEHVGIAIPPPPPASVTLIGREVADANHYILVEDWVFPQQVLWGFDGPPEAMTDTGKQLFVNVAWYMP
jgi:Mg-chelatase subunit ChlD